MGGGASRPGFNSLGGLAYRRAAMTCETIRQAVTQVRWLKL